MTRAAQNRIPQANAAPVACLTLATLLSAATAHAGTGGLDDLFRQFQTLTSLHFTADAAVEIDCSDAGQPAGSAAAPAARPVFGHFEYWAAGPKYRIRSHADLPGMSIDVAWNGSQYQLLLPSGVLSVGSTDSDTILPTLPNPLLQLVQFCYPETDANLGVELRLRHIQGDDVPDEFWSVQWTPTSLDGEPVERAIFPGGTWQGRTYVHHVYARPGEHRTPLRIDRVDTNNVVFTSAEFSDYRRIDTADGPTWWPHQVLLQAFDEQGRRAGWVLYKITTLEVNTPLPAEAFTIPKPPPLQRPPGKCGARKDAASSVDDQ